MIEDINVIKNGTKIIYTPPEGLLVLSQWLTAGKTYTIKGFYNVNYGIIIVDDKGDEANICYSHVKTYFTLYDTVISKGDAVNHPIESWRTIGEFPNYEVSNFARVRNKVTGLIKIPSVGKRGYPILNFIKDGNLYVRTLHRVFAIAWIPNPENKREINHINGDKCDCSFGNLEWVTPFENMEHARRTGLHNSDGDKAVWQLKDGEVIAVYKSCSEAARVTGFNRSSISSCARGNTKLKTYKGYE